MEKRISLSKSDWVYLLRNGTSPHWETLKTMATLKKESIYGKEVFLRGIIEFSNYCRKNCLYCGIRKDSKIKRYRLRESEIIETSKKIYEAGLRTVVLQSGEDLFFDRQRLVKIIKKIKKSFDIAITLCIGERSSDDYRAFFDAGASRFLIKHETSNPRLYEYYHPGEKLKERLKLFDTLKKIGYQVGLGNIVGLPFSTLEDYVNDVYLMKALDADMAGIGPFVPSLNTPLFNEPSSPPSIVLKLIIMTRLLCNDINLPATTALYTTGGDEAIKEALISGANVLMPNFTPDRKRQFYKLYDNKKPLSLIKIKEILGKTHLFCTTNKGDRNYANYT